MYVLQGGRGRNGLGDTWEEADAKLSEVKGIWDSKIQVYPIAQVKQLLAVVDQMATSLTLYVSDNVRTRNDVPPAVMDEIVKYDVPTKDYAKIGGYWKQLKKEIAAKKTLVYLPNLRGDMLAIARNVLYNQAAIDGIYADAPLAVTLLAALKAPLQALLGQLKSLLGALWEVVTNIVDIVTGLAKGVASSTKFLAQVAQALPWLAIAGLSIWGGTYVYRRIKSADGGSNKLTRVKTQALEPA